MDPGDLELAGCDQKMDPGVSRMDPRGPTTNASDQTMASDDLAMGASGSSAEKRENGSAVF